MSATFCLPVRNTAEDGGVDCLPRQNFDGWVNISIVDLDGNPVGSLVLNDGSVVSGSAQRYPIDPETGDMRELVLATEEDFSANSSPAGLRYQFDYRYRMDSGGASCSCGSGCSATKTTRGTIWVPIQASNLYTLDAGNCVQVAVNGSTDFVPAPGSNSCYCPPPEDLTFVYDEGRLITVVGETYQRDLTYVGDLVSTVTDSDTGIVQTLSYDLDGFPIARVVT